MIYLGSDHAGYDYKEVIKSYLTKQGLEYIDLGTNSIVSVDYPDFASQVTAQVSTVPNAKGILICGTGMGMCIAANRIKGIRAVAPYSVKTAKLAREHNNANVLCLGGRIMIKFKLLRILKAFLTTHFSEGERHIIRIEKLDK